MQINTYTIDKRNRVKHYVLYYKYYDGDVICTYLFSKKINSTTIKWVIYEKQMHLVWNMDNKNHSVSHLYFLTQLALSQLMKNPSSFTIQYTVSWFSSLRGWNACQDAKSLSHKAPQECSFLCAALHLKTSPLTRERFPMLMFLVEQLTCIGFEFLGKALITWTKGRRCSSCSSAVAVLRRHSGRTRKRRKLIKPVILLGTVISAWFCCPFLHELSLIYGKWLRCCWL